MAAGVSVQTIFNIMELVSISYVYLTWIVIAGVSNVGVEGVAPLKGSGDATSLPQLLNAVSNLLQYYQTNYVSISVEGVLALRVIEGQLNILVEEYNEGKHRYVPANLMVQIKLLAEGAARITNETLPHLRDQVSQNSGALMKLLLTPWTVYHPHTIVDPSLRWDSSQVLQPEVFSQAQSRQCVVEIINSKKTQRGQCAVSKTCLDWMTQPGHRGHVLQQQIYYLTLSELASCKETVDSYLTTFGEVHDTASLLHSFCTNAYYELEDSVRLYGLRGEFTDLFLQTEFLCPSLGFFQFLQLDWLEEILTWQDGSGCFIRPKQPTTTTGQQQSILKKEANVLAPLVEQTTTVHTQKYQQGVGKPVAISADQQTSNTTRQRTNLVQQTGGENQMVLNLQSFKNKPVPPPKFIQSTNQAVLPRAGTNIVRGAFTIAPQQNSPTNFGRSGLVMSPQVASNHAKNNNVMSPQFNQNAFASNFDKIPASHNAGVSNIRTNDFVNPPQVNHKVASNFGGNAVVNSAYNIPARNPNHGITQSAFYGQPIKQIEEHHEIYPHYDQHSQINKNYNNYYNQNPPQNNIQYRGHNNLDNNPPYAQKYLQPNEDFDPNNNVYNDGAYPAHQYQQPKAEEFHQYQYIGEKDQQLQYHNNQHAAALSISNHNQQQQRPHHIETREAREYNVQPRFDFDPKEYENHRQLENEPRNYGNQRQFEEDSKNYRIHPQLEFDGPDYENHRQFQNDPNYYGNEKQFEDNPKIYGKKEQFEKNDSSRWKTRWLLGINLNQSSIFVPDSPEPDTPSTTNSTIFSSKDTKTLNTKNELQKLKLKAKETVKPVVLISPLTKIKDNIKPIEIASDKMQTKHVDKSHLRSTKNASKLSFNASFLREVSNVKKWILLDLSAGDVGQSVTGRTVYSTARKLQQDKHYSLGDCDPVVTSLAADVLVMYIRYMVNHGPPEFQNLGLIAQRQAASKLEIRNQPPPYSNLEYDKPMVHEGYPQHRNRPLQPPGNSGQSYIAASYRPLQPQINDAPVYRPLHAENNIPNVPVNYHSQMDHHAKVLENLREVAKIPPYRAGSYYISPKYSMHEPGQGRPNYYPPSPEETIRKAVEIKELPDRAMYDTHQQQSTATKVNLESPPAAAAPPQKLIQNKTLRFNNKSGKLNTEYPDAVYIGGSAEDSKAINNMISIQERLQADLGQYMAAITVLSLICLFIFLKYTRCRKISFRHRTKFI